MSEVVSKNYYRILVDKTTNLWHRIAFWTTSDQIENSTTGTKYSTTLDAIKGITSSNNITQTGYAMDASYIAKLTSGLPSGTLTAGSTSLTITDSSIYTNGMIDVYTTIYGVNPESISVGSGTITLTFEAQATDMGVKVRCI